MNILTWTILKKTQILNGCDTFAFKYIRQNIDDDDDELEFNDASTLLGH